MKKRAKKEKFFKITYCQWGVGSDRDYSKRTKKTEQRRVK